ncbi:MAG: hypothetical protein CMJ48_03525 [Planctomycetaceae bacterium]|nr:hypothetical protein [Planctomycetaceae bacterium]
MPLTRETVERQLEIEKGQLAHVAATLKEQGVADAARSKNPHWRRANARISQLNSRLASITGTEEREAAALARKSGETDAD